MIDSAIRSTSDREQLGFGPLVILEGASEAEGATAARVKLTFDEAALN